MGRLRFFLSVLVLCVPSLAAGQAARSKAEVFDTLQGAWADDNGIVLTDIEGELFLQYTATFSGEVVEEKGLFALQRMCPINALTGPILVFRTFDDAWCYKLILVEKDRIEFVETDAEYPGTWYRVEN